MKWLNKFKIAVIQEDSHKIDLLLKDIPEFKKIEDMREAYALIGEAKNKFEQEQVTMIDKMNKMQQAKKFLNNQKIEARLDEVY